MKPDNQIYYLNHFYFTFRLNYFYLQPSEEKKVSDFRNKFEKFGGVSKSLKRVSVPSALDVISSASNSNKIVKYLQKQIEDLENQTTKERESLTKKNEKLKQEFEKESEEFKEKNQMVWIFDHFIKYL